MVQKKTPASPSPVAVLKNYNNSIYLRFREAVKYDYFVRLHTGQVEIAKLPKGLSQALKTVQGDNTPKHCAEIFLASTLQKTEKALRVLQAISKGDPIPELDGIDAAPVGDLETKIENLTQKERMDIVGNGTIEFVKGLKDDKTAGKPSGKPAASNTAGTAKDAQKPVKAAEKGSKTTPTAAPGAVKARDKDPDVKTLADICKAAKIDPVDARKLMRKAGWEKPAGGRWEWNKKEADTVQADIEKLIKAEAQASK